MGTRVDNLVGDTKKKALSSTMYKYCNSNLHCAGVDFEDGMEAEKAY